MSKTSKNILDEARASIKQIDIDQARKLIDKPGTVLIDVRESDEWRQGHIPQAIAIPRGFLELRIEEKVPDHKTPVILQCASGTRSLLAARTLQELGYENVYNMTGGFNSWKDRGSPWVADRAFTQDEITRYSRHFVIPEVGEKGQARLLDAKVLHPRHRRTRIAHRRSISRPPESAPSAWSISMSSISRTCSARSSTPPIGSGCSRPSRRKSRSTRSTRPSRSSVTTSASVPRT